MLNFRPSGDYVGQMSNIAITNAIMRNKLVELLHKQLVRKGRADIEWINHPKFGKVYNVKRYDIKSPSRNPYNYDSRDDLGLNQFFMGQDPYKPYRGNPKDGIYHDKCLIYPKAIEESKVFNLEKWTYKFFKDVKLFEYFPYVIFAKHPNVELISNENIYGVLSGKFTFMDFYAQEEYDIDSEPTYEYVTTILNVEVDLYKQSMDKMGNFNYSFYKKANAYIEYNNLSYFAKFDKTTTKRDGKFNIEWHDMLAIGILYYISNSNVNSLGNTFSINEDIDGLSLKRDKNVYLTGYKITKEPGQYTKEKIEYFYFSDGSTFGYIQKKLLGPRELFECLLYDGANAPLIGTKRWLDSWNNNFRLYVKEDKETWQVIATPVIMIVGAIVTVISAGSATGPYVAATGILLGVSMVFTGVGMATGSKTASRWAKYTGIASAVIGVGAIISNMARTAAGYVAKSSASTLSSQGACSVNGLNTTASLYDSFAINSASQAGVSVGVGGNPALASSASPLVSSNVTSIAAASFTAKSSSFFGLLKDGFKSFNSVKKIIGAFKNSGEFRDEDMPEGSNDERHDAYSSEDEDVSYSDEDVFYYKRRFYELHKEYDLGLEDGTLMSLESEVLEKV